MDRRTREPTGLSGGTATGETLSLDQSHRLWIAPRGKVGSSVSARARGISRGEALLRHLVVVPRLATGVVPGKPKEAEAKAPRAELPVHAAQLSARVPDAVRVDRADRWRPLQSPAVDLNFTPIADEV